MVKVVIQNERIEIKVVNKNLENIHMEVYNFFRPCFMGKVKY